MLKQLILKLVQPEPPFRLYLDPWAIRCRQYPQGELSKLNGFFFDESKRAESLAQSSPLYVEVLRDRNGLWDRDLALFFRLTFRPETEEAHIEDVSSRLRNTQPLVEYVERAKTIQPAAYDQDYAGPREKNGVDAEFVWDATLGGWQGQNVQVCLIDKKYDPVHQDLPGPSRLEYALEPFAGIGKKDHATRCLGVLVAKEDPAPVTGIAHGLKKCYVSSITHYMAKAMGHVELAIDCALADSVALEAGDVILIPHETTGGELVEADFDVYKQLLEAYTRGIVVVEAAGNHGTNHDPSQSIFFGDSHAVVVGAGYAPSSNQPLERLKNHPAHGSSGYGPRVDCQGWGEKIATTQYKDNDPEIYTSDFGGTSGASSMVAGVVSVLQSIHREAKNVAILPEELRTQLRSLGQLPASSVNDIGPLPDIRELLWHFELLPNIYLREVKDDKGEAEVGAAQAPFEALDIIPRRQEEPNPDGAFVDNGNWDLPLGRVLNQGDPSWIYLRVQNGGPFEDEPTIRLYWAKPGAESSPDDWEQIDGEVSVSLGPGEKKVLGGWKWEDTPVVGELCLIAVVQSKFHDTPGFANPPLTASDLSFLHEHRKITYRRVKIKKPCGCLLFWKDLFG